MSQPKDINENTASRASKFESIKKLAKTGIFIYGLFEYGVAVILILIAAVIWLFSDISPIFGSSHPTVAPSAPLSPTDADRAFFGLPRR